MKKKTTCKNLFPYFAVGKSLYLFIFAPMQTFNLHKIIAMLLLLTVAATGMAQEKMGGYKPIEQWEPGIRVSQDDVKRLGMNFFFRAEPIPDHVFQRMQGKSYPKDCPIPRKNLRYLRLMHVREDGKAWTGEMVCNKSIAKDLVDIFRELYQQSYPIERMLLIDDFNANDEQAMSNNNSSCFCYRTIANKKKLSKHAQGLAVDINTLYNPYYIDRSNGTRFIQPATGAPYCDRSKSFPYKINKGDLCYRLFISHGFRWGGEWHSCKDFQHFEK